MAQLVPDGTTMYIWEPRILSVKLVVARMRMLGAEVDCIVGKRNPQDATNEALRDWISNPTDTFYLIDRSGPHPYPDLVARLQAIISEEISNNSVKCGTEYPDYVIACEWRLKCSRKFYPSWITKMKLIGTEAAGKARDMARLLLQ